VKHVTVARCFDAVGEAARPVIVVGLPRRCRDEFKVMLHDSRTCMDAFVTCAQGEGEQVHLGGAELLCTFVAE
jgi:hypothetical protein